MMRHVVASAHGGADPRPADRQRPASGDAGANTALSTPAIFAADGHTRELGGGTAVNGTKPVPDQARPKTPRISVVIPTLNEAKNLPHVFAKLPSDIYEIVLVDGNSTDETVEVARELYPDVRIVGQSGRGKGNALKAGFNACRGDIIVMLDADGSADGNEIPRFVEALLDGADFAKGSRFIEGGGSADITRLRRLGNAFLSGLVNLLYRTSYSDLCYGYNAFWASCLPVINVDCDGFEVETLINIRVARAGLVVTEVPSFELDRIHGESNLRTFRDGFRVLKTIVGELRREPIVGSAVSATAG